jgi:hypothetical protein
MPNLKVVRSAAVVMTTLSLVMNGHTVAVAGIFGGGVLNHMKKSPFEQFEVCEVSMFKDIVNMAHGHDLGVLILADEQKKT